MLTKLHVQGFKSLRDLSVEFGRFSVLVGANGCGKSSVLQAIMIPRRIFLRQEDTLSLTSLLSQDPKSRRFEIDIVFDDLVLTAHITPFSDHEIHWMDERSELTCTSPDASWSATRDHFPAPRSITPKFARAEFYRLDTQIMESPAYSEDVEPTLGIQGEGLGAVLDAMHNSRREHFLAIEESLRRFIPNLRALRLRRAKTPLRRLVKTSRGEEVVYDQVVGHQVLFDFEHAHNVPADQASEGTLLLLGLLTIVGGETGDPRTILLDDLDRALHPKAQKQLVDYLHALLEQRPDLQIIATSHSPYLVEHLQYEEVLAMTQSREDGRSLIAPLAEHPDVDRWREEMSAGEFWSSVGEDWIRDRGQP